ncbi:MAG TPA: class I lanthipeptide [Thermoanaerobaculia bacterium]|jgi:hypothetical protein|nr:class I lanthipeptide [Thermoanaerobaculia bacterium]
MKKQVKKLQLNRETVSNLTRDDLRKVAGGSLTTSSCTVPRSCCATHCLICTC